MLIKYLLFHKYDDGTRSSGIVFGPYDVLTVLNLGVCLGIETVTPHEDDRAPVRMYRLNPNDLKKDPNDIPELAKSLQNHV